MNPDRHEDAVMLQGSSTSPRRRVLIVDDHLADTSGAAARSVRALATELRSHNIDVGEALSCDDGQATVSSDSGLACVLVNWTQKKGSTTESTELLRTIRASNTKIPIFLMASRQVSGTISVEVATLADEFIWVLDDTAAFISGRVVAAIDRYVDALLPPFTEALARYDREREYSWAAPGHQGGVAFLKSPIGRAFFDFYGENLFRTDMGIERGALGSVLGHSGPIGEAEKYAAQGCKYYKMKIHDPDPKANRARVEAVKRAVGSSMRLMVDVNQRLDVLGNMRQAGELEHLDLLWYEEPVLADDYESLAEVARSIRIPVATGENNYTRYEFRDIIQKKGARFLMPDVCRANGFSETLKIGHLAAAHGVQVSPHVVHEISLHVVGALGNGFLVEYMDWAPPDLFEEMPACKGGRFRIPDRPGHGMSLAPGAIDKYRTR